MDKIQLAGNVLATIHRDGGQHITKVGWDKACYDAVKVVVEMRLEIEKLRYALDYYADKDTYHVEFKPMIETDQGKRAREALEKD